MCKTAMEVNSTNGYDTMSNFTCFEMADVFFYGSNTAMDIFKCVVTTWTSITAVLENVVILVSIWRNASLHTPSNVLLFSLALSDLAIDLVAQPLFIAGVIARIKRLGRAFCFFALYSNVIGHWLCSVSLLSLTCISLERYIALYLHLRYREVVTVKRIVMLVVLVWTFGALVGATSLLHLQTCRVASLVVIFLSILLASFAYVKVYRVLRHHQLQVLHTTVGPQQETTEKALELVRFKRSAISTFLVYILLVICYLPYFCILLSLLISSEFTSMHASAIDFASMVVYLNSTLNPLVYCWRMSEIRAAVWRTLPAVRCGNTAEQQQR